MPPTAAPMSDTACPRPAATSDSACAAPLDWMLETKVDIASLTPPSVGSTHPVTALTNPVTPGWTVVSMSPRPPCIAASSWPKAPSNVLVDLAASTAASWKPRSMRAWLNSSAEISPFSMASRKFPV